MKPAVLIRSLYRPVTVLYLAVLFALLETLTYLVAFGPLASLNVLLLASALATLAHLAVAGRIQIALYPEFAAIIIFFVAVTLSRQEAINAIAAGAIYRRIISDLALFVLAGLMLQTLRSMRGLLVILLITALFLTVDLLVQSMASDGFRVSKEGWDGNEYAVMCVALAPACFALIQISSSRLIKYLSVAAIVLIGLSVILTASRTAMLLYGIAIAMLVRWKQIRPQTLVVGLLIAVLVLPFLPAQNLNRLIVLPGIESTVDKKDDPYAEKSYLLRVEVWKHALTEMVPENLLLGVGLSNWNYRSLGGVSAHNMYLSVLGEHGLVGLSGFLAIIAAAVARYRRAIRFAMWSGSIQSLILSRNLYLSLLLLLLGGMTLTIEFRLKLMWLLLGVPLSLKNVIKSEIAA